MANEINCLQPLLGDASFRNVLAALENAETNHPFFQLNVFLRQRPRKPVRLRPSTKDLFTLEEVYCQGVYTAVLEQMKDVTTIIDLGANIGISSVFFLDAYRDAKVFAVEPDPLNFELLKTNLKSYANRVDTFLGGLWQENSKAIFARRQDKRLVNEGRIIGGMKSPGQDNEVVVEGLTISSLIEKSSFDKVDVLKVDIEGNEEELFRGRKDWLENVRCIAIEFHDGTREKTEFDKVVGEYGFTVLEPNPHTVLAIRKT